MSDKLQTLEPNFRAAVENLLESGRAKGISMVPYFALRTPHEQARLWRQSRPAKQIDDAVAMLRDNGASYLAGILENVGPQNGPHVTNALPGASWHQWATALDCYWEVDGKAEWSTTRKVGGINGYQEYAKIAQQQGLTPGGLWTSIKDWPHVQASAAASPLKEGKSWAEIDQHMREMFGSAPLAPAVGPALEIAPTAAAASRPKVAYRSPHGWQTYYTDDVDAAIFRSRMTVCADGAPKAYHRDSSKALDYLGNAGRPGNWWAIATDDGKRTGNPVVQGTKDPAPGYYVSMTAMPDPRFDRKDPRRYVDATSVPYVVLPGGAWKLMHPTTPPRLGDLAVAYNLQNGLLTPAMFAEVGPADELGEASITVASRLGINADAKKGGTQKQIVVYLVFPGSGTGNVLTAAEIDDLGSKAFNKWGGMGRLHDLQV